MSQVKTRSTPTPQALHRKRTLLIAGVVTVLPAAALAPGLLAPDHNATPLLAAVDDMAMSARPHALANERAVEVASLGRAKPQARLGAYSDSSLLIDQSRVRAIAARTIESKPSVAAENDPEVRWFNGRPVRPVRTLAMLVTAYSPDAASCGESADGITASGYSVWTNGMKLVAADTSILPFGSLITVPGYDEGAIVPVLDRGGAIKGNRLDVLYPTHEQATHWGAQRLEVTVWEYADGQPSDFEIRYNSASALR